jgi:23S rRNA maturation-related 3'-5' exoribonuclease YhaM
MKEYITKALLSTKREGMEDLLKYMEDGGFFTCPCSGGNHLACEGGLGEHTKNVMEYAKALGIGLLGEEFISLEKSIIIAAALHDLGKMGQFDKPLYVPNVLKNGKQSDTKPYAQNKDLLSVPHEVRSVAIASMFIDLTEDEQHAILYHNGLYGDLRYAINGNETPLYMVIHFADLWVSREVERKG